MWYVHIYERIGAFKKIDKGFNYIGAKEFLTFDEAVKFMEKINGFGTQEGMIYSWQLDPEDSKLKITKSNLIKEIDIFRDYVKEFMRDISEGLTDPREESEIISCFLDYVKYALGKM